MTRHILRLDASMRVDRSTSRDLADALLAVLEGPGTTVTHRDLADGVATISEHWIGANFTPPTERSAAQEAELEASETLIREIEAADTLVIALPIYNFGVPAAFKAWIDLVVRARRTFQYGEEGPVGLLTGKQVFVIVTSGGTRLDSDLDFVSPWLRHVLGFIGLRDVEIIDASGLMQDEAGVLSRAKDQIGSMAEKEVA